MRILCDCGRFADRIGFEMLAALLGGLLHG